MSGPASESLAPARPPPRDRWIFAWIFAFALALRLVATFQYQAHHPHAEAPVIDEASYDRWAREIAGGEWLGSEVFFQEPLYPYAMAAVYGLFGPERIAMRIVQCALGALAAVLVGLLARRIFGRRAGVVAALAWAAYWPGLLFPPLLLKENVFVPLVSAFALLLVTSRTSTRGASTWLAIGVLGGLGALLRGNMLVLLPLVVLWPVVRALVEKRPITRSIGHAACAALGIACILVPVAWRNHAVGGVFVLTTSGAGTNLYGGNNLENEHGRASEFSFIRGIPEHEVGDWRREAERRTGRALNSAEVSEFWKREVFRSMREHPREHVAILWNKLRLTLGAYEVPDNHMLAWDARYVPIAKLPWPGFGIVGALGIAGLVWLALERVRSRRARELGRSAAASASALHDRARSLTPVDGGAALELALFLALYLATIVLTVTSDRARLPLVPLLAPFAAYACVRLVEVVRSGGARALVRPAVALAAGFALVHAPVLSKSEIAEDFDERDYNLVVQWLDEPGRADDARAIAATLAQRYPRSARMQLFAADVEFRRALATLGDADVPTRQMVLPQIAAIVERVDRLADEPTLNARERFRAASLSGWIRLERGDWVKAERRFREALGFDGESPELLRGLVRALLGQSEDPTQLEGRAKVEEALALIATLRGEPARDEVRDELALLHAQASFQRGRFGLDAKDDEVTRAAAQSDVRAALEELQMLARAPTTLPVHVRRARALAGWIQLALHSYAAAENHFRAALAIASDPASELGLAQALVNAAEDLMSGEARTKKLDEARAIAAKLAQAGVSTSAIDELRARLAAAR